MKKKIIFILLTLSLLLCSKNVLADLIKFNNFDQIDNTVTISDDGFTAIITEDTDFSPVGLWGPNYTIPSNAIIYYLLIVPQSNEDYFDIYIGNFDSPIMYFGGTEGNYYGKIDLSSYADQIGLAFVLSSDWQNGENGNDNGHESKLIISNYPVPEPSTIILLSSGLLTIPILRKRLKTKK